jgi:hypothetical protein
MANPFLSIREQVGNKERSLTWYKNQVKALVGITPERLLSQIPETTSRIIPGNMYMFLYEAKYREILPYWDQFPLVIPFKKVTNGFLGMNLHYLPYNERFKLLGYLHDLADDNTKTEGTKLQISWSILNSSSKFDSVKPCVKHYLYEHLNSRFLQIQYPDWVTASMLPVERFQKRTKQHVWRESRKQF